MQRGEPYERTYRRRDRSINTEAFTAGGGRREDQGTATLKGLPRGGGRSEQYPKAFGFGGGNEFVGLGGGRVLCGNYCSLGITMLSKINAISTIMGLGGGRVLYDN